MRKPTLAVLTASATLLATSLACSGMMAGMGGNAGNKTACEAYVKHMNGLECLGVEYKADEMCAMVDKSPLDMEEYYNCMAENSKCEGKVPKIDISGCKMPTM